MLPDVYKHVCNFVLVKKYQLRVQNTHAADMEKRSDFEFLIIL